MHVKKYHHTCIWINDSGYIRHSFRNVSVAYTVPVLDITFCNLDQASCSFKVQLLFVCTAANKLPTIRSILPLPSHLYNHSVTSFHITARSSYAPTYCRIAVPPHWPATPLAYPSISLSNTHFPCAAYCSWTTLEVEK